MTELRKERYINPYTDFGFKKLFEQAEIAKYDETERRQYYESRKEYWDYTSTMDTALNKGRAEGRAEGLAEGERKGRAKGLAEGLAEGERKGLEKGLAEGERKGRAEGLAKGIETANRENARRMKDKGFSSSDISEITGLCVEDIQAL